MIVDSSAILAVIGREADYQLIIRALAVAGEPLLCIGDDFAKTDLPLVSL